MPGSGDNGRAVAAELRRNLRELPGDPGQRRQCGLCRDVVALRIGLVLFEVDAQGRAFGARTGEAKDDARAVVEADADALPGRDRRAS